MLRTGTVQVRLFRDSGVPTLTVVLDDRASRYRGDLFEDAVEVAASVLDLADRHDLGLVIATASGQRSGTAGERLNRADLLDVLTRVTPTRAPGLGLYDPQVAAPSATVVVISGCPAGGDGDDLIRLRAAVTRLTVCAVTSEAHLVTVPRGTELVAVPRARELPSRWEAVLG